MIDRRTFGLGVGGMAAAGAALLGGQAMATVNARIPVVIAHRGASGERPEHTALAYRLAVEQGADFIEPDLVVTRDGHLVARHENEIGATTDVASMAQFAGRKATRVIDGESITGWFTEDFTLAELKTLRCRERLPRLRQGNTAWDGQAQIMTFQEVVDLARAEGTRVGRRVGVYPEMKHPAYFAGIGLAIEGRMVDALKAADLTGAEANCFVQCFEVAPLKTLRGRVKTPLVQLVSKDGGPADLPGVTYARMTDAAGLKAIAAYADGVGPQTTLVVPTDGKVLLPPTALVADAHAAGLKVHPWTVRRENFFLPTGLRTAAEGPDALGAGGDVQAVLTALFKAGVDGLFSDFPGEAVKARNRFIGANA